MKNGPFGEKESLKIMKQIIEGCRELRKYSVVHRDLKPANILESNGIFKIADFGVSKSFSS